MGDCESIINLMFKSCFLKSEFNFHIIKLYSKISGYFNESIIKQLFLLIIKYLYTFHI